ncbi:MAG TPA: MarR family transcriptional regulator [Steroidobacteraceae bacterium]|nr:MarR family transcriptional regulator [Steroidobacteraceae bacterium]
MRESPLGTIYLLKRAELAVRSCVEAALAEFDLTPTQFLMMFRLRDRHEVSAAELAREIGVRPQSIMEVLAPLERKRLIKREASREHRRILHTRLTPAGQKLFADALRVAARIESELLSNVSAEQVVPLQQALSNLWERAEKHELYRGPRRERAEQRIPTLAAVKRGRNGKGTARRARIS